MENERTTPEEHEELVNEWSKTFRGRPESPHNVHMWMSQHLPFMGMNQEKHINDLLMQVERVDGRFTKIRFSDWEFHPRKVTPEDLIACAKVINGWARALKRPERIRCGLDNGQYFVLMLRQRSCVMCPEMWQDATNVFHSAIARAQMEHTCQVCYDVGEILKLGSGCCGDPACTDLVNANPVTCACKGGNYESDSD